VRRAVCLPPPSHLSFQKKMDNKAQMSGTGAIIGVVGALVVLIVYFSVIPLLGDRIDSAADITQDDYATGTLTFSGEVANGQTINISTDRYEFDTDGSIVGGNIAVTLQPNASATGTLTFSDIVADAETINISTDRYEFDTDGSVTSGNIRIDLNASGTPNVTATYAAIMFTANVTTNDTVDVGATRSDLVVTLTADDAGSAGNSIATTTTCLNASFAEVTLTGGSEDLSATYAATRFTAVVATNDTVGVGASRSGDVVTLTADATGAAGNSIATTETCYYAAFGAATLTGGTTASEWASDDITTASDLWEDNGSMIAVAMVIVIVGVILLVLRGAF